MATPQKKKVVTAKKVVESLMAKLKKVSDKSSADAKKIRIQIRKMGGSLRHPKIIKGKAPTTKKAVKPVVASDDNDA